MFISFIDGAPNSTSGLMEDERHVSKPNARSRRHRRRAERTRRYMIEA